jgi:hypothetical protein
MVPRRTFLGLVMMPAALTPRGTRTPSIDPPCGDKQDAPAGAASIDPQVARLRAIEIDESVEPALVFRPAGE